MRTSLTCTVLAAVSALTLTPLPARSQDQQPCIFDGMNQVMFAIVAPASHGQAFSAIVQVTFDQTLSDGNSIRGTVRYRVARNSSGKTMNEAPGGCYVGEDGHRYQQFSVHVMDPSAQTNENWQMHNDVLHIAIISHIVSSSNTLTLSPEEKAALAANAAKIRRDGDPLRSEPRRESLGSRMFQGVSADGTKTTQTIPAGDDGNLLPIEIVNEIWRSKDLDIMVMSVSSDPRRGHTTTEVEELRQGEPDPAMFSPPAGYTIKEQKNPGVAPVAAAP